MVILLARLMNLEFLRLEIAKNRLHSRGTVCVFQQAYFSNSPEEFRTEIKEEIDEISSVKRARNVRLFSGLITHQLITHQLKNHTVISTPIR